MKKNREYLNVGFTKIESDLAFLMGCLREVLHDLGESELAQMLPWQGHNNGEANAEAWDVANLPPRLGQAYALSFQLLNMIEENTAAQIRRGREKSDGLASEKGLWGHALHQLKQDNFDASQVLGAMQDVRVEPVLTVHPTEAKRASVLEQHRALYLLMFERENPVWTPSEQAQITEHIKTAIERLWRTGEILVSKPDISDERRNLLHYLREVFPAVLPRLDARLEAAWEDAGWDAAQLQKPGALPRLSFGTWAGGDRDGHPLVTAEVTRETLLELRANALRVLRRHLDALWEAMSLSSLVQSPPPRLQEAIARLESEIAERDAILVSENFEASEEEPWRQFVGLMRLKLPLVAGQATLIDNEIGVYRFAHEVQRDLQVLADSLHEVGAERVAHSDVRPVLRALEVFGLHLAVLDVRQNSQFHDKALSQLMRAARVFATDEECDFASWDENRRLEWLNRELESPRPFLHANASAGPEADAVLECYRVLAHHSANYGTAGIGALIVSMTRSVSDLLVVYLLAREAGLVTGTPEGLTCALPVVPLFETESDLRRGATILASWLQHPITRRSLQMQSGSGRPTQQVMVGYSDSNKDSGILASQWALHRAQSEMAEVGRNAGFVIRFFHGRGGTISRGAGPTHRFLEALPARSLEGDVRLTEQGETIAQKFANQNTATYNLELLLAGTTAVTAHHKYLQTGELFAHPLAEVADQLAIWSRDAYQSFLRAPDFMTFYEGATPLDALQHASIGSRPARRTGARTLDDLRAIPWVFSWNQARFYLPGWFGIGTALKRLSNENPLQFEALKSEVNNWPLMRYVLTNVETNLSSADLGLMNAYAELVEDADVRHRFMGEVAAEWNRSREMLTRIWGEPVETRRPRMHETLQHRARALTLLHHQQIYLLRQWRSLRQTDEAKANEILPRLLLSINAIASGLRTTG